MSRWEYLRVRVASLLAEERRFVVSWRRCEPVRSASAWVWEIHPGCCRLSDSIRWTRCQSWRCCWISSTRRRPSPTSHPPERPPTVRSPRRTVADNRHPSTIVYLCHYSSNSRRTRASSPRTEAPSLYRESRPGPTATPGPPTPLCPGNFAPSWPEKLILGSFPLFGNQFFFRSLIPHISHKFTWDLEYVSLGFVNVWNLRILRIPLFSLRNWDSVSLSPLISQIWETSREFLVKSVLGHANLPRFLSLEIPKIPTNLSLTSRILYSKIIAILSQFQVHSSILIYYFLDQVEKGSDELSAVYGIWSLVMVREPEARWLKSRKLTSTIENIDPANSLWDPRNERRSRVLAPLFPKSCNDESR